MLGKTRFTPRDNRKWYTDEPELRKKFNHLVKHRHIEVLKDSPTIRNRMVPESQTTSFIPEKTSMIKQAMYAPTYRTAAVATDSDNSSEAMEISNAKLDAGSEYARG